MAIIIDNEISFVLVCVGAISRHVVTHGIKLSIFRQNRKPTSRLVSDDVIQAAFRLLYESILERVREAFKCNHKKESKALKRI